VHLFENRLTRVVFADLSVALDVENFFSLGLGPTIPHGQPTDESYSASRHHGQKKWRY
jgi:hypothetical protein